MRHLLFCLSIFLYLNSSAQQKFWDYVAPYQSYYAGVSFGEDNLTFCYGDRDTLGYTLLGLNGDSLRSQTFFRHELKSNPQFVKQKEDHDLIFTSRNLLEYYPAKDSLVEVDSFPWKGFSFSNLDIIEEREIFWIIKDGKLYRYDIDDKSTEIHFTGHADKARRLVVLKNKEYLLLSVGREAKNSRLEVLDSNLMLLNSVIVPGNYQDVCPVDDGYYLAGQKDNRAALLKLNFDLEEQSLSGFVDFWEDALVAIEKTNDGRLFALSFSVGDHPQYPDLYTKLYEFDKDGSVLNYLPIMIDRRGFEPRVTPQGLFAIGDELIISGAANVTDVSTQPRSFVARVRPASVSTHFEQKNLFEVYPNPVVDKLYVKNDEEVDVIKVYSTDGKCVATFTDWSQGIKSTSWPRGIYQLVAHTNDQQYTRKIIKN